MPPKGQFLARDLVTRPDQTGRARAESLYAIRPCEVCGREPSGRGSVERHHIDSDRLNNGPSNIRFLCRKHHIAAHRVGDGRIARPGPETIAAWQEPSRQLAAIAAQLHATGQSFAAIGRELSVTTGTVFGWRVRYPDVWFGNGGRPRHQFAGGPSKKTAEAPP